ncbi:hypothetical protein ACFUN7_20450 [Streptomyces sp. NPDC057236]|uniref:hypothetical protein n=1 Tax=Streptomyces sp. NPDC057236 TaxID=3346059 RepID=UPI003626C13F
MLGSGRPALAQRLGTVYSDAVAVETESAGVSQAAHPSGSLPVLSIRGISDHADGGRAAADAAGSRERAAALGAVLGRMVPVAVADIRRTVLDVLRRPDLAPGPLRDAAALSPAEPESVRRWYPTERGEESLLVWRPGHPVDLLTGQVSIAVVTTWGVRLRPSPPLPFAVAHTDPWSCDFSLESEARRLGPLPVETHRLTVRHGASGPPPERHPAYRPTCSRPGTHRNERHRRGFGRRDMPKGGPPAQGPALLRGPEPSPIGEGGRVTDDGSGAQLAL